MSTYKKPYLSFAEQLTLLKSRGLEVTHDQGALSYLRRIGYYRLSGYWYPFRNLSVSNNTQRQDTFKPGSKFQNAVELYVFDKKLRLLLLDAIERIEIAVRVDIAYLLGSKDPFAYKNPDLLHGNFTKKINFLGRTKHEDWLIKHDYLINRSKEEFVRHFREKYGFPLPIWVVIELWDFGLLSTFYQGMQVKDKAEISKKYGVTDWQIMESWLRCLNYIRNVVAHHSRLWNRNLVDYPKLPKRGEMAEFNHLIGNTHATSRIYVALCIVFHFLNYVCPNSSWKKRLCNLILNFPTNSSMKISDMGFPVNWQKETLWSK